MKTKNVHQEVSFKVEPKEVYHLLMDSDLHTELAGSKTVIGSNPGDRFSIWEGGINGFNLALIPDRKIVQAWRAEEWPKDHYSIAVFELEKTDGGTELIFDQYGIPDEDYENICEGWKTYYWAPMKSMFKENQL